MEVRVTYQVLLLALLASLSVSITSSQGEEKGNKKVLCVKPDVNSSNTDPDCHHLSYYMENSSQYFQNNTIFWFQAGIHYLTGDLTVSDVHDLELKGEAGECNKSSSQIYCSSPDTGNMVFVNDQNLTVSHLLFSNCGGPFNMTEELADPHATLALLECQNVKILHIIIRNGTGIGLFGYNVHGNSLVNNSAMLFNKGNSSRDGGNIFFVYSHSNLNTLTELVIENTLVYGGFSEIFWVVTSPSGLTLAVNQSSNISITVRGCNITNNTAHNSWGGNVQLSLISEQTHPNNHIIFEDTSITYGVSTYYYGGGGGMYIFSSISQQVSPPVVNITGCKFDGNEAESGGALYMYGTTPLTHVCDSTFENNMARDSGGAIFMSRNDMYSNHIAYYKRFRIGDTVFRQNQAVYGGAIGLGLVSTITFIQNTTTTFISNSASRSGGAIYTTEVTLYPTCFAFLHCINRPCTYKVHFINNTANRSGNDVYLARSQEYLCLLIRSFPVYKMLHLHNSKEDQSRITSGTTTMYFCIDEEPQFDMKLKHIVSYPGKTFNISATVKGYSLGNTFGSILASASTNNGNASLPHLQQIQKITSLEGCSNLSYTVMYTEETGNVTLTLISDKPQGIGWKIEVKVTMTGCPRGFQMQGQECGCVDLLRDHGVHCDVQRGTVLRPSSNVWIGFVNGGVVYYPACPYNYCKKMKQELNLSSSNYPKNQCASNRQGLLCSQCPENYSLGLGTSACLPDCSSIYLLLILPFALAGIVLVLFLIIVDLTVSKGCLNGIIFYANIVWLNKDIYLPPGTPALFRVFIAWINLSLGIETCFYKGMNAYSKTWLRYVFPVYLWGIMLFMYLMSSRSYFFTKLIRKNSVQVLATLFLLSCTKLIDNTITIFSVGHLMFPHGRMRTVWLPDATIDFYSLRNLALFCVGLFFLLLLIPYILFLLLGHLSSRLPGNTRWGWWSCILRNRLRLLTFSQAYTGMLKDYRKPWIGLLVLARIVLLALYATNYKNEAAINLVCTGVATLFLLLGMALLRGLYVKWYLDVLEVTMLFNLLCFSVSTLYTMDTPGAQTIIVSMSVGMTLLFFILILAILLYKKLPQRYKIFKNFRKSENEYRQIESVHRQRPDEDLGCDERLTYSFSQHMGRY